MAGPTLRGIGARGVSQEAIAEAADAVAEKIDVLLERATDTVLGAPRPGSPQWRRAWESRESEAGRVALEQRVWVKIAIAEAAGVDSRHELDRARRAGVLVSRSEVEPANGGRPRRRGGAAGARQSESQQLSIW